MSMRIGRAGLPMALPPPQHSLARPQFLGNIDHIAPRRCIVARQRWPGAFKLTHEAIAREDGQDSSGEDLPPHGLCRSVEMCGVRPGGRTGRLSAKGARAVHDAKSAKLIWINRADCAALPARRIGLSGECVCVWLQRSSSMNRPRSSFETACSTFTTPPDAGRGGRTPSCEDSEWPPKPSRITTPPKRLRLSSFPACTAKRPDWMVPASRLLR